MDGEHCQISLTATPPRVLRPALAVPRTWLVGALVLLHIGLALWWSTLVPLGEGPDEPGHFAYVLFLAREGRLPLQQSDPAASDVPGEGHQPPLAYWLMQPAVRWLPAEQRTLELGANPAFRWNGGAQPNAFFRSSRDIWPYQGVGRAWHLARAVSALLGGLTVLTTYLAARRVWPEQSWLALGATAVVALHPQMLFAHALVSNDPLLIALGSLLLLVCLGIVGDGRRMPRRDSLLAGALLGLMLITKQSALLFVPLPLLALAVRGDRRWRERLGDMLLLITTALAISAWWFARNLRLYGDVFGLAMFRESFATGAFEPDRWQSWQHGLWNLLRSSWGMFGWLTIALPDGLYRIFGVLLLLAAIGQISASARGLWRRRGRMALLLIGSVLLALLWVVLFAFTAGAVAWQGRFLLPAISALAILLAGGLGLVFPARSALWLLITLLALLAPVLPRAVIAPAYPSYVIAPPDADFGNVYGRFSLPWKRGIELRDVQLPRQARMDETITLQLTWHALERMDRRWAVFIHLVDQQEQIVAQRNAEPLDGAFPMSAWVAGDWIRDPHGLRLSAPPGSYEVRIGVWDPHSNARLGVYDRDDQLFGDYVSAGTITITGARSWR